MRKSSAQYSEMQVGLFLALVVSLMSTQGFVYASNRCDPEIPVDISIRNFTASSVSNAEVASMFRDDQSERAEKRNNHAEKWRDISFRDRERRRDVIEMLVKKDLSTGEDFYYAAAIFLHGTCSEDYKFARELASESMNMGYDKARRLYANSMDRYLLSIGEPQKFGTQYQTIDGEMRLMPVDPSTTNAERIEYDVPPLSDP